MQESNSKRIAKNTSLLYIRMLFIMLINIFSVRFVLKGLGVEDYGIFNVVASFVTMFSGLSSIVSSATLRFHSYSIGEGKEEKVSDVFTASFNIYAVLCLIIFMAGEIAGLWFINYKMVVPEERLLVTNWVYQFSMVSFVLSLMTAPFSSIIFAYEKMHIFSIISVVECTLKFILAISLLYVSFDHLIFYGLGLLIIAFLQFAAYFIISRRSGMFHYKHRVEKALYKRMLSFSGWTLFSSSASIGISQLVTMITNIFFGPVVNAARAIAFQISASLNSFTYNIILAVKPPMIKFYAEGDYKRVITYFNFCNKVVFYALLLILLPIFFELETILKLWLDISDTQTLLFTRLIIVYAIILSLNNPISIIIQATGSIKNYSTYVEIPTLMCFPATWFSYWIGMPAEWAFYIMIIAILVSHAIRLVCLKKQFPVFSYKNYFAKFLLPSIVCILVISFILCIVHFYFPIGVLRFIISLIISILSIALFCLIIGFEKKERDIVFNLLKIKR